MLVFCALILLLLQGAHGGRSLVSLVSVLLKGDNFSTEITLMTFKYCIIKLVRAARGRPKKNWMEGKRKAMNERNLNEGQWEVRKQWSLGVGQRRITF